MKSILQKVISLLARFYLWRYRPLIVAVTGNAGKTSTKEAIVVVLKTAYRVRVSGGNLNNEWGVPLTILGDWTEQYYRAGGGVAFWLGVLWKSLGGCFLQFNYPQILVLEYGADHPGDIEKLANLFRPEVGVVTAVGEIPVHVEYFSGPEEVAREKAKLVSALISTGSAVLNYDDENVLAMERKTKAKVWTFGFGEGATVRASNFDLQQGLEKKPTGVIFKLHYGDSFVPVRINGSLGRSQAWAASAATAVGLIFKINLAKIGQALSAYRGPAGRLKIIFGIKDSVIIDDTYNASPASVHLALETLKSFPAKRRLAILGDMLELGSYTVEAHQSVGSLAGSFADLLITVGARAKFIAEAAGQAMSNENIFSFDSAEEAKKKVAELIKPGDVILVKGSQGIRMEKIVEAIMAEPEKKSALLVRQSKKWLDK